jgi:alpha-N-arabinofuranosidase
MRYECIKDKGKNILQIVECIKGEDVLISKEEICPGKLYLKIVSNGQNLTFYYGNDGINFKVLQENVNSKNLSTEVAGGFVGCTIGMYASSNGNPTNNYADFYWFEYKNTR